MAEGPPRDCTGLARFQDYAIGSAAANALGIDAPDPRGSTAKKLVQREPARAI
jgi:hypothetical protein